MQTKEVILVIGSSMTMPRLEVGFTETWLYRIMRKYNDYLILDKSRRASTTDRLINDGSGFQDKRKGADVLEYYSPKVVITQIGITDCAPRLLNKDKLSTKMLNVSPGFIKNPIYKFLKKNRVRSINNADVNIIDFEKNWVNYIERARPLGTKILCILISKPTRLVRSKSPEIYKSIELYNAVLHRLNDNYDNFTILEPYTQDEIDLYALDEFHVSEQGHDCLFKKIDSALERLL